MRSAITLKLALFVCVAVLTACSATEPATQQSSPQPAFYNGMSVYNCTVLNTEADEFAPVLLSDTKRVLFTSNRKYGEKQQKLSPEYLFGEAIYITERETQSLDLQLNNTSQWPVPEPYTVGVLDKVNTGTIAVDEVRNTMIVGGTYGKASEGGADLFSVAFQDGTGVLIPLNRVNSPWWDSHPALAVDGNTMVFASDRVLLSPSVNDSGSRAPHLWISTREGESWSVPELLPWPINSDASEMSPFFASDGYLYFATSRWEGSGFEIVRSKKEGDSWRLPELLPKPLNSPADDCFPFITADQKHILFASNREGGLGGFDIWCAEMPYNITLVSEVRLLDSDQIDSISAQPAVRVSMEVVDVETQKIVNTGSTDDRGMYTCTNCLKVGRRYILRPGTKNCYDSPEGIEFFTTVPETFADTVFIQVDLRRVALPELHAVVDSIPFFVTGYWYPNTTAELQRLHERRMADGELPNANYIDTTDYEYDRAAIEVDKWFEKLYDTMEQMFVPMLDSCYMGTDTLVIRVLGYVDPRRLTWGLYEETIEVKTLSRQIRPGTVMVGVEGNVRLSHLRAFYAKMMIDHDMTARSERYRLLRDNGRIQLESDGGFIGYGGEGTKEGPVNDPQKRKFTIHVEIRSGEVQQEPQ